MLHHFLVQEKNHMSPFQTALSIIFIIAKFPDSLLEYVSITWSQIYLDLFGKDNQQIFTLVKKEPVSLKKCLQRSDFYVLLILIK